MFCDVSTDPADGLRRTPPNESNNMTDRNVRKDAPSFATAERIVHALLAHKAEDVVILDLRPNSDVADLFVIATGNSEPQVTALARAVLDELCDAGEKPLHTEGLEQGRWALIDFVDIVVHVMLPRSRTYYDLERLWNDAERREVSEDYFARPEVAERHPDLSLVRRALAKTGDNETE